MTVLIKNVQVVRGDGSKPTSEDIFIAGNKISAIGSFPDKSADEVLDGQGGYAAPGFIDIDTTSDHYLTLFDDPGQEDFLKQGVSTITGGQCGSSLAPLLYGTLEAIQKWTDISKINVDWHTTTELLSHLDRKLGINFATLTGHSTVRRAIVGEELRDLTPNELSLFTNILMQALREGSLGLSTGLEYVHARNTAYKELKFLAGFLAKESGLYATHLRNSENELEKSIDETIRLARETNVRVIISHLVPIRGHETTYARMLEKLDNLPREADVHFDVYPFPVTTVPIHRLLPIWIRNGNFETMLRDIHDGWMVARIIKELPDLGDDEVRIAEAPGNPVLSGKTLGEMKDLYGLRSPKEALLQVMIETGLRAIVHIKNVDEHLLRQALSHSRSLIASHAAAFGEQSHFAKSDRNTKTFPELIRLSLEEGVMPIEEAIRKITSGPAKKLGIHKRGELREGNVADCVVFRGADIRHLVLGGKVALRDGETTGIRTGELIRKGF